MIDVPAWAKPHINTDYPKHNKKIFEEWLTEQSFPELEREFIPIHITSYWVNHNYGNDLIARQRMQQFFDGLDRSKKYWICCQYDDSLLIDTKDLDIVTFGMSYRLPEQKPTYVIPLIGQMPPRLNEKKKYFANFIGNITHPVRKELVEDFSNIQGWYVSTGNHTPEQFYKIISQSKFTLCPVGYGKTSFRFFEAIHHNSIPVFIYEDELLEPYGIDVNEYAIKLKSENLPILMDILNSYSDTELMKREQRRNELYNDLCSYEGICKYIIKTLKNETLH